MVRIPDWLFQSNKWIEINLCLEGDDEGVGHPLGFSDVAQLSLGHPGLSDVWLHVYRRDKAAAEGDFLVEVETHISCDYIVCARISDLTRLLRDWVPIISLSMQTLEMEGDMERRAREERDAFNA